jgi:thioredoxin-dependent peroxiredoxin
MLVAGDLAPDFAASNQDGTEVRLSGLRGAPVVLYFYPKAGTAGCTRESVAFAKLHGAFQSKGVRIIGISVDDVERQKRFSEDCRLPFPLLSDTSREIARAYGALGAFGHAKRVTFLIDGNGRIAEVIDAFLPGQHVERAQQHWLGPGPDPSAP